MKKKIIFIIISLLAILGTYLLTKEHNPVIQINEVKTSLDIHTYDDILDGNYVAFRDNDELMYLMSKQQGENIIIQKSFVNDKYIQLGIIITDKINVLKLDDHDILHMSKQDVINKFQAIEIVNLVNFEYLDNYYISLRYQDNQLTDFVIQKKVNDAMKLRNADIFYDQSIKEWKDDGADNIW